MGPYTYKLERRSNVALIGIGMAPLSDAVWTMLGPIFGFEVALEVLGEHSGSIFALFGRLSVSTSFLDP